jgi:hypothetical protein
MGIWELTFRDVEVGQPMFDEHFGQRVQVGRGDLKRDAAPARRPRRPRYYLGGAAALRREPFRHNRIVRRRELEDGVFFFNGAPRRRAVVSCRGHYFYIKEKIAAAVKENWACGGLAYRG